MGASPFEFVDMNPEEEVHLTELRPTVQARFPDGRVFEGHRGTPIEEFILAADLPKGERVVASLMNGRLRELCFPLQEDADLVPVTTATNDGARIYRRSLSFLMIVAAAEVLPGQVITIFHSMPFGGYYCERDGGQRLTDEELAALRRRMRELVEADLPIDNVRLPLDEALAFFRKQGDQEKADLFARRRKDYLTLYELNGVRDYFHGFMVNRTRYLDLFDLRHYNDGFILQFPRRSWPNVLQPFEDEPRLAQIFQTYKDWLTIMGVGNVTALNEAIANGRSREIILVAEALHERQLASIARSIANRQPSTRLVAVSGPTSAGKTTFAKKLCERIGNSLYVNWEGISECLDEKGIGSWMLYCMKSRNEECLEYLQANAVASLPPPECFRDIRQIEIEDLRWFREAIQRRGQYAGVVFDIGGMALASYAVFGAFDRILIPTLRDTVSQKKQKVFEQMLRQEYEKTENLQYVQLEGQDVDQIADMYVR